MFGGAIWAKGANKMSISLRLRHFFSGAIIAAVSLLAWSCASGPGSVKTGPDTVNVEQRPEGTWVLRDLRYGYEIALQPDWTPFPLRGEAVPAMMKRLQKESPIVEMLLEGQVQNPVNRAIVFNLGEDGKYFSAELQDAPGNSYATSIVVAANRLEGQYAGWSVASLLQATVDTSKKNGAVILASGVVQNAQGVEYGNIDARETRTMALGAKFAARERLILFKRGDVMVVFDLVTPLQFGDQFASVADDVAASIKLSSP
jgi:hypothetical protein